MGGTLQDEVNYLLRPLKMGEAAIHKAFGGTKGVFNSNELVSLFQSSFDPNGTRWRSRSIFSRNSSPNRDVWRQEKIIVEYKVPEGISDSRAEKQAEAWDELRPGWIQTLRRLVSANGDYEECLRALNLALRSKRLSRLASFVETNIRDAGILLNPPLAADLLIYTIDSSYSTANYGTTNNSADWHACTSRIGDEDESFLSRRVVKAYMKRITKSGHTEVSIFGDEFHREELNKRIGDVLSNDPFDPDRGCEAYEKYTNKMDVLNRQLESGQISAERVSGVIVCEEITKPMQQWSLKRERQNLHRGSRKLPTIQGGGPAATAAVASMHFDSCPPQTPPISPSLMAASATLPPQIALPMPQPISKKGAGPGQAVTNPGKGAGNGAGRGGKGMGAGRGGQEIPPPASMITGQWPKATFPAHGLGREDGKPWNEETWNAARIDFNRIITDNSTGQGCAGTLCENVLAKAYPLDASLTAMRRDLPDTKNGRAPWAKDACRYCYFRGLPTPFTDAT